MASSLLPWASMRPRFFYVDHLESTKHLITTLCEEKSGCQNKTALHSSYCSYSFTNIGQ
jgi:hypothetical protein